MFDETVLDKLYTEVDYLVMESRLIVVRIVTKINPASQQNSRN